MRSLNLRLADKALPLREYLAKRMMPGVLTRIESYIREGLGSAANPNTQQSNAESRLLTMWGLALLVLTIVVSLLWSSNSLLSGDEYFSLWTDRLSTLAQIAHVQRTSPVSIDPLLYHVASHIAVRIFGARPFAIRLPSLVGFLIMQVGLYFFVRRITSKGAAILALAFPALTSTLFYSFDGRPYGMLLGFWTLTMVSWQAVVRRESRRTAWLITLAIAIALTVNLHYFGVLIFVPLSIAEFYRSMRRRSIDIPVLSAIVVGATGVVGIFPFLKAANAFRAHYCCHAIGAGDIREAYLSMFPHFRGTRIETLSDVILLIAGLLIIWSCLLQLRRGLIQLPGAEAAFLFALVLLPLLGYILAMITTKVMEPRYVIGAFPALSALVAISLGPIFRLNGASRVAIALTFLGIAMIGIRHILLARKSTAESLETLKVGPEIKAALRSSATGKIYFQDSEVFAFASYYEPDADILSRLVLVYSPKEELRWNHTDTGAFQAMCMQNFTSFDIEPYESITDHAGKLVFAVVDDPRWDWTHEAFENAHARITPAGAAFGADVLTAQFHRVSTEH